jgi:hypothetical protein
VWIATPSPDSEEKTAWTAHRQPVQIGATRQGKAEIQAGLPPGSRVIVAGMERLREGQRVSVVPWSLPCRAFRRSGVQAFRTRFVLLLVLVLVLCQLGPERLNA